MSRAALLLVGLLWALPAATVSFAPGVPTPESVLGKKPGDDFYLASYDESRDYFRKLAAASDRVKLITVGKTTRGLDWEIAILSSPENLKNLARYKEISQQLADGRGLDDAAARALAREGQSDRPPRRRPPLHRGGWRAALDQPGLQAGRHAGRSRGRRDPEERDPHAVADAQPRRPEPGHRVVPQEPRHAVRGEPAARSLPGVRRARQQPRRLHEQHARVADGDAHRARVGRREIFYCHHQTAPFPTRIFIPPFTEPISRNIHPLMARWLNVLGIDMAAYLDEHGMPGAVHRVGFDNWYPGFLDFTHIFRNSIAFFTETALYPTRRRTSTRSTSFRGAAQACARRSSTAAPGRAAGGGFGDAVATCRALRCRCWIRPPSSREDLLYNRYQAGARQHGALPQGAALRLRHPAASSTTSGRPRCWSTELLINGIEVHQATKPFTANGREHPAGTWVVLMDQPFAPLVKELFEPQQYPELRESPNGPPLRPYDVTGWTLPMQMGVNAAPVLKPLRPEQRAALRRIDDASRRRRGAWTAPGRLTCSAIGRTPRFKAVQQLFAAGAQLAFSTSEVETAEGRRPARSCCPAWIARRWRRIARENSLVAKARGSGGPRPGQEAARRTLPFLDAQHRRRLDALDSRRATTSRR